MRLVTADEMRKIDNTAVSKYGIASAVLMERAGLAVAEKVRELFRSRDIVVLAGGGNNGGDGIVAARYLKNWDIKVRVLMMLKEDRLSPDCLAQYRTAKQSGVEIEFRKTLSGDDLKGSVVVDALLGTGLNKDVTSYLADVIRNVNTSGCDVISVDMPSGISSDNGQIMGEAVRADYTISFGLPKVGHYLHPGAEYRGVLFVEEIGFPSEILVSDSFSTELLGYETAALLIPERQSYSYKGDYGHVLIVAGSRGKTGAAMMAAKACLRSGAGLVTIGVPETLVDVFQSSVREEMVLTLPDNGRGALSEAAFDPIIDFIGASADVLVTGPGITSSKESAYIIRKLLETATVPMVLDADAINVLSGSRNLLKKTKAPVIITPHIGEMAMLMSNETPRNELINQIRHNGIETCRRLSRETGVYVILKGSPTCIFEPDGRVFINSTGNPGMATAGSGDVLAGMTGAFLGQSMLPIDAANLAVYLHGLAGDRAAEIKGMHSLIASDIIDQIPSSFISLNG